MKDYSLEFIGRELNLHHNHRKDQVGKFEPFDDVNSIVKTIANWTRGKFDDLFTFDHVNFYDTTFDSNNKISAFKGDI